MDELLTTRQVQSILKVDRTTIYRMLRSGRLKGVKVGQQWRFREDDVRHVLGADQSPKNQPAKHANGHGQSDEYPIATEHLQSMQDVFASFATIGAITTELDGTPCTQLSNCCRLCSMIWHTPLGRAHCIASWRRLAQRSEKQTPFFYCHAGMCYARAFIEVQEYPALMLIMGQFLIDDPPDAEVQRCVDELAERFGLDVEEVEQAVAERRVLDADRAESLQELLGSMTHTLEQIGEERADLLRRLRQIAAMSRMSNGS